MGGQRQPLDLIVLDLDLPLLYGWMVLGEVKTDEAPRSIPIVILIASADESNELQALERALASGLALRMIMSDTPAA